MDILDQDVIVDQPQTVQSSIPQNVKDSQSIPDEAVTLDEDKYGSLGQQAIAGLEGAFKGVAGFLAPQIEQAFGVKAESIKGREEANPITHGAGQIAGLGAGLMTGTGVGGIMAKAGEAAVELAGLAQPVSYIARVGSTAVQQAAEMAVLQGSDEAAKIVMNDPETSSQSAIANIGLAAALGGAGGGLIAGAVSPLWQATLAGPTERLLGSTLDHLNQTFKTPEAVQDAANTLGIELDPTIKAAVSGSPKAGELFSELRESGHEGVAKSIENLEKSAHESVLNAIGKTPEDIANYSEAEGGRHALDTFKKEYQAKYEPISKEYDLIAEPFKSSQVSNTALGELTDRVVQTAQEKGYLGADIPQNKLVEAVVSRIPEVKSVQDLDNIIKAVNNIAKGDLNLNKAGHELKNIIFDAQQSALGEAIKDQAPQLFDRYTAVRGEYSKLAKLTSGMSDELGLGKFEGPKTFLNKLSEKRSPEQFLSRLSPKGNAEILETLGQHFPSTLEHIRDNELKKLLRPAILGAKGESPINMKILHNAIEKSMAGQPERLKFALSEDALKKITAAKDLMDALPKGATHKSEGIVKQLLSIPSSALGLISMLTGHNGAVGWLTGHLGELLYKDSPDAIKYGLLRLLSSDQPVKAEGFKAMVDFIHNSIKGETMLTKGAANVFKSGAQVLTSSAMPSDSDRQKLSKLVDNIEKNPDKMYSMAGDSHTGYYLPNHQTTLTQTSAQAVKYLQSIKPQPYKAGPLDKEIAPSFMQNARYNRALDIAQQPAVVMQHIKDGTLQVTDIADLKSMYPSLYTNMAQKLSNEMINKSSDDELIPYKTKVGLSLFLGQPVDSSMNPQSIIAAQPIPQAPPQQSTAKNTSKMGKTNASYQTPSQAREASRTKD